ncbi:MAG: hypothetical protein ACLP9K_04605 [Nitrososphaerales archaeon]
MEAFSSVREGDGTIRAHNLIYDDYWFLSEGIIVIRVLSLSTYFTVLLGWIIAFESVIFLSRGSIPHLLVVGEVGLVLMIAAGWWQAHAKRSTISRLSPSQVLSEVKSSKLVEWEEIYRADLNGARLALRTQRRSLKMRIKKSDLNETKALLQLKLASKFSVRQ